MSLYTISCVPTAASATAVGASHSPGSGAILIDGGSASGGVATLGAAQKVTLVSGGNDSGITFTVTGTDADGKAQTEIVQGVNANTATSAKYFKTVTSVVQSAAVAGTLSVGCAIASVSPSYRPFRQSALGRISVGYVLNSGTATFELQDCFTNIDDGQGLGTWIQNGTVKALSASGEYAYGDLFPYAIRLSLSASSSGNVSANFVMLRA